MTAITAVTCDRCPTIRAKVEAYKGNYALHFCGVCERKHRAKLERESWRFLELSEVMANA